MFTITIPLHTITQPLHRYTSDDATVYSIPERNNSPSMNRVDVTKMDNAAAYATVNHLYGSPEDEEDEQQSDEEDGGELEEGIFTIEVLNI